MARTDPRHKNRVNQAPVGEATRWRQGGDVPTPGYRFVPCPGNAHRPEVGGMQDNCTMCAPRWGLLEVLKRETIMEIATRKRRGGPASARELARIVDAILLVLYPRGDVSAEWDADTLGELGRVLADYAPEEG